jgi:hypothetical protein
MSKIPDFTDTERHVVETTVKERFGKPVEVQVADAEIRLYTGDRELTEVPVLYWHERDCQFVIFKVADNRFRNQFFYSVKDQFGTGREEYDDIGDCVLTLLRVQADHDSTREKP